MSRHTHAVTTIDVGLKETCADIGCYCGAKTMIGLWYSSPPKGWAKTGWSKVIESAQLLHDNWYKHLNRLQNARGAWIREHEPSP